MKRFDLTKLNRYHGILFAEVIAILGILCMFLCAAAPARSMLADTSQVAEVPGAGAGQVIESYVGATKESSTELLSTTALGATLTEYNEFYDAKGSITGKLIIYDGEGRINLYNKIPGNERIEKGESLAIILGRLEPGAAATMIRQSGSWYQVVSEGLTGYVRAEDFRTGEEAEAIESRSYKNVAITTADETWIMDEPAIDGTVICALPQNVMLTLLEAGDEYSRVSVPGLGEGWISNGEAAFTTVRKQAVSVEEEAVLTEKVVAGIDWAADIEARLQEEARGRARSYALSQIEPAAPDSDDIAALRNAIASYAQEFVGILPYIWASSDLTYGVDCSGFTSAIYRAYGIDIPRSSDAQAYGGMSVSMDDLRPGDIIAYPGHVALYIGGTTVVHAPGEGTTVSYGDLYMMEIINVTRYIY